MSQEEGSEDKEAAERHVAGVFPSRLLMDMMASQLSSLEQTQLQEVHSSNSSSTAVERDDWVDSSLPSHRSSSSRPPTGLSLAALAKAERALERPVTITNGGTHVAFSQEDVHRIRDPAVLRFMEENSSLFARYLKDKSAKSDGSRQSAAAANPDLTAAASSAKEALTAAQVEASILSLRREIETFITAVDEDGRNYRILTNEEGNVVVPVAEALDSDDDDGSGSAELMEELETGGEAVGSVSGVASLRAEQQQPLFLSTAGPLEERRGVGVGTAEGPADRKGDRSLEGVAPTEKAVPSPTPPPAPPPTDSALLKERTGPKGRRQTTSKTALVPSIRAANAARLPPSSSRSARVLRASPADTHLRGKAGKPASLAPPAKPVRPVRALLPEEEERVERLLREDIPVAGPSPFALSEAASRRVAEIDERLSSLRVARRAQRTLDTVPDSVHGEERLGADAAVGAVGAAQTRRQTNRLGNAYMQESRAAAQHRRKVQQVNTQLLRIHREIEELALSADASESLPADVRAMRPRWACASSENLPNADVVAELLEEAEEEQRRYELLGTGGAAAASFNAATFSGVTTDPYASLRETLSEARRRAEGLLAEESHEHASEDVVPESDATDT